MTTAGRLPTTSILATRKRVTVTIPTAEDIARTLATSAEADRWHAYALAMWRDGYLAGRADESAERDALWHANAAQLASGESFAELERRRSA